MGILSSTVSLLWNKARDSTAAKLKDGDITDAKIREIVVRELNDIKSKLDGLSRKDLLSSYSFLKEGVDLLNVSLSKSKFVQKADANETQDVHGESGILNEALKLYRAIGKLKIASGGQFECAKERFKDARRTATHAFCNEALSIQDTLMAAKLRIVATILECLESPETAIVACLSFLKELHSLKAITEMFSVYLSTGVKSRLSKSERAENVKSVMLINDVLFQFTFQFSSNLTDRIVWPGEIKLNDHSFNPIRGWRKVSTRTSWGEELVQPPNAILLDQKIRSSCSAVNKYGELLVSNGKEITAIYKTGESKVVMAADTSEFIESLAIDRFGNLYVVVRRKAPVGRTRDDRMILYVFEEKYSVRHEFQLVHLPKEFSITRMALDQKDDIIILQDYVPCVFVCDKIGQLKYTFAPHEGQLSRGLAVSDKNEIMIISDTYKAVKIFTDKGEQKFTITVPTGHRARGIAFHYIIGKIIVLTYLGEEDSYFLLCYSRTCNLESSTSFIKQNYDEDNPHITSHSSGPVAVVQEKCITFI